MKVRKEEAGGMLRISAGDWWDGAAGEGACDCNRTRTTSNGVTLRVSLLEFQLMSWPLLTNKGGQDTATYRT